LPWKRERASSFTGSFIAVRLIVDGVTMLKLHPSIIKKNGKKEFAVLPYDEFQRLAAELQDFEDLKALRVAKAREGEAPTVSLGEARKQLGV
jgi:hypothetical protein